MRAPIFSDSNKFRQSFIAHGAKFGMHFFFPAWLRLRVNLHPKTAQACALELPKGLEEEIIRHLEKPVWDICLGRKNCPPSDIVYRGVFPTAKEALAKGAEIAKNKLYRQDEIDNPDEKRNIPLLYPDFTIYNGKVKGVGPYMVINDVPLAFGQNKRYQSRFVTIDMNKEREMEYNGREPFVPVNMFGQFEGGKEDWRDWADI